MFSCFFPHNDIQARKSKILKSDITLEVTSNMHYISTQPSEIDFTAGHDTLVGYWENLQSLITKAKSLEQSLIFTFPNKSFYGFPQSEFREWFAIPSTAACIEQLNAFEAAVADKTLTARVFAFNPIGNKESSFAIHGFLADNNLQHISFVQNSKTQIEAIFGVRNNLCHHSPETIVINPNGDIKFFTLNCKVTAEAMNYHLSEIKNFINSERLALQGSMPGLT